MSRPIVALVGLAYLVVAINSAAKHEWPMAVVFTGYAFSNVGFWFAL